MAELGLRYRPSARADLEAHAHALRLLAEDVADLPPALLEQAAKQWARESRFMPKASELAALAKRIQAERDKPRGGVDLAAEYNRRLDANGRDDIRWIGHGETLHLVHASELETLRKRGRDREAEAKYGAAQ